MQTCAWRCWRTRATIPGGGDLDKHHLHHDHVPKMIAWRQQVLALIEERDRRVQLATSGMGSAEVLAELRHRAGMGAERPTETAALEATTTIR